MSGRYEYELEDTTEGLKVMRMRMIPGEASGNTQVLEEAQQRADITPPERNHTVEQVTFQSGGETLKGWLYMPDSPQSNEVVIAAGSWTTVKEQMPMLYYEQTGEVLTVESASTRDSEAAMYIPTASDQDYYFSTERGLIPQWGNQFAVLSWPDWLSYNPHTSASQIQVPTVIFHSEDGAVPEGAKTFISEMTSSPEVHWVEGTQFDFYDGDAKIREALGFVTAFVESNS